MGFFQFIVIFIFAASCKIAAGRPGSPHNVTAVVPGEDVHDLDSRAVLHLGDANDFWCDRILIRETAASTFCHRRLLYHMEARAPVISRNTVLPEAGKMKVSTGRRAPGITATVCDQLLPPSFVLDRLRTSGTCNRAALARDPTDARNIINRVKILLESDANRLLLQQQRLFGMKKFLAQAKGGQTIPAGFSKLEMLGVMDYILLGSTRSLQTAKKIDIALGSLGSQAKVYSGWQRKIEKITRGRAVLLEEVRREIGCMPGPRPGAGGGAGGGVRTRSKLDRRYLSSFDDHSVGTSTWPSTSLERRIKKTPKSGPKAPAAPACPGKKQKQKKTIPRSKVQTRPKRTTKPRRPAKLPAAKAASTKKRVAPRPATRTRRQPGKQVTVRRVTPKKKPRIVPKPSAKPKGKPRTRRRR